MPFFGAVGRKRKKLVTYLSQWVIEGMGKSIIKDLI
jgi:hypothetical protein